MSTMEERFKRAYKVLDEGIKLNYPLQEDYRKFIETDCIDLRLLRNEASLWEDYKEDVSWIIGGVSCDPNHPDNLSDLVFKHWQAVNGI